MTFFQTKEYLDLYARHFVHDTTSIIDGIFEQLPNKNVVLLGMKPVLNSQEITDFGDIPDALYDRLNQITQEIGSRYHSPTVEFDYIKESSPLFQELTSMPGSTPQVQEVSPFIALPETWDLYLESLDRVERKELKRKWRRLETISHEFRFSDKTNQDSDFETFITLHKLSDHNKEKFMTDPMKLFFKDLLALNVPGWHQKMVFLYIENKPAAALFYFESENEVLLYNSGYDPEQKYYSVGLLLTAYLIKQSIESHKQKFDFLRGNERYKYDLGGKDERLFKFIFHLTKSTSA